MCFNAGIIDRTIRVGVGIALIAYGVSVDNMIVTSVGAIPLLTGVIGFCPLYPLIKLNTGCKRD